jgi:7,8-dihydropterin-6-yl-methyl-4-(beta-D-ribofuranosyl)aminobenzene 5'-phosphate synthase
MYDSRAVVTVELAPVDAVDVTLVMDLSLDLLMSGQDGVRRFALAYDWSDHDSLLAEHGFSALITVTVNGNRHAVLYDGGLSPLALQNNLDVMQVDVTNLRAITISHGHVDHHGGLEGLFRRHGPLRLPLIIHPDAWRDRKIVMPTGAELHLPPPSPNDLEREGVTVIEERGPTLLIDDTVLVSGQVARVTAYEKGFPIQMARSGADGEWEPDPWTWDDQNLVVNVRDLGLVIVSGCSHAGVVNVVRNAQMLTGITRVAGLIGGFHLTGGLFEPLIPETVNDLTTLGIDRIVPAHCTGWRAMHALANALPGAFLQPSVGSVFEFRAPSDVDSNGRE